MSESDSDKSIAPSKRRRQEARREGHLARSRDLHAGLFLLVVAALLQFGSATLLDSSQQFLSVSLESVTDVSSNDLADHTVSFLGQSAEFFLLKLWPVWIFPLVAAGLMLLQIGPFFQPHLASPDLSRFANGRGLSKLWSSDAWLRLALGTIKLLVLSSIAWVWTQHSLSIKLESELSSAYQHGCAQIANFLGVLALGLIAWGGFDYFIQWIRLERKLRMTPEEQRAEQQEFEPDPRVRHEMISLSTRTSTRSNAVSINDLLVTDGLTRCIVLRFDPEVETHPRIVFREENRQGVELLQRAMRLRMTIHESKSLVNELFLQPPGSFGIPTSSELELARLFAQTRADGQSAKTGEKTLVWDPKDRKTPQKTV